MTSRWQTRREFLTATAAISATAALGGFPERSFAQGPQPRQIDAVLRRAVEAKEVPGVVAIAANDKGVIYEGAFGTRNLAQGAAMTPDTIFRIASMTKAVTSVAAMQLVEQGRLQLAQPIGGVLPELSAPQVLEGFDDAGARPHDLGARTENTGGSIATSGRASVSSGNGRRCAQRPLICCPIC